MQLYFDCYFHLNIFYQHKSTKKNSLISEKYVQADLFLSNKNSEKAKKIFEEIIFSENKFYSILALNTILEEDLEKIRIKYYSILRFWKTLTTQKKKRSYYFKKSIIFK